MIAIMIFLQKFWKNIVDYFAHLRVRNSGWFASTSLLSDVLDKVRLWSSSGGIVSVLLGDTVVGFPIGFERFVVTWGLLVVTFCNVAGFGLEVVPLERVGFSDNGFWVVRIGLFVVADGLFVGPAVADKDDGLVVGFRVGLLVVMLVLVGFLVMLEGVTGAAVVPFPL